MKRLLFSALFASGATSHAASIQPMLAELSADRLSTALGYAALFAVLGIALTIAGFKLFDLAIRKVDLEQEIQKGNVAAAILAGSVLITLGLIVAAAITG